MNRPAATPCAAAGLSTFLSEPEIHDLTGYQLPSAQKRWLTRYGWTFAVSALGRPKVLRTYAEHRMGLASTPLPAQNLPDFSHWKAA